MEEEKGSFLLIDKPVHWTSFDVIHKLRSLLKIKKIGHAGTLDPLATGLLIVCTGKMTKQIDTFQGLEKEYTGKMVIGQTTPSYDLETEPSLPVDISSISREQILNTAKKFIGTIQQVPPVHSSIKVDGKRAYTLARKGEAPVLKPREVVIRALEIVNINAPEISFKVICSKGTYIRSLAHDFGQSLGVGAYLSELRRTRIGEYSVDHARTMEQVKIDLEAEKVNRDAV